MQNSIPITSKDFAHSTLDSNEFVLTYLPETLNLDSIPESPFWNTSDEKELKMHRIHAYPAKFPSFITTRAIEYAEKQGLNPKLIADIFCGCGTAAFEAKRNGIDFWGCDINPVATLIATVKSHKFQRKRLDDYYVRIIKDYMLRKEIDIDYNNANERIKYWFDEEHYKSLERLKQSIIDETPSVGYYRDFFLCAFSNILKPTSRWLTKSIKSQVDPDKKPSNVLDSFTKQVEFMIEANEESDIEGVSTVDINRGNVLDHTMRKPKVDLIVTSPPYVTSYDYSELHQLSTLWLDYVKDYRDLRKGSIGRPFNPSFSSESVTQLNPIALDIVERLKSFSKAKARDVGNYFLDMQKIASLSFEMVRKPGMSVFVIGNTELKGVIINNAHHLAYSMIESGYKEVRITKRKISNKIMTPYRDPKGKFTRDNNGRNIYSEEFILIGVK